MKNSVIKSINDVIADEDCMWIISDELPCLFRYDYLMQKIELKEIFPETVSGICPFSRMVKLGNEIYFIPWLVKDIYYYDITKDEIYKLDIFFKEFSSDNWRRTEAVVVEGNLYCINRAPDAVIEINPVTKEVQVFQVDMQLYADSILPWREWTVYPAPCFYREKIIWTNYKNILTVFDIRTKQFSVKKIEEVSKEKPKRSSNITEDFIIGVKSFEEALWLFTFEGRVYRYDNAIHKIESGLFEGYAYYDDADGVVVSSLYDIVPIENELFFIPAYKNKCIKYNGSTKQYEKTLNNYTQSWEFNRRNYTICKVIDNKKILLYSYYENIFYIPDTEKNGVLECKIEDSWMKFAKENPLFVQAVNKNFMREEMYEFDDLEWLIQSVIVDGKKEKRKLSVGIVGKQIYVANVE